MSFHVRVYIYLWIAFIVLLIFNVIPGWQDDSMCSRRMDDYWGDGFTSQAFTTGRRAKFPPPPTKPRPKASQTLKVSFVYAVCERILL